MPYIDLNKKTNKRTYESKTDNLNHQAVYNTQIWRELRIRKLVNNPLCEVCSTSTKPVLAITVHHITPISTASTKRDKQILGFDYQNLQSLCSACHKDKHNNNYLW